MEIICQRCDHAPDVPLPRYATSGSAGCDLVAALEKPLTVLPRSSALVPTGLMFQIPEGYEGQIRSRSGLALKNNLQVLNTPGTIDSDYRGEVKVILFNHGTQAFIVAPGMRIAQFVIAPVVQATFKVGQVCAETERKQGGFGSTGL